MKSAYTFNDNGFIPTESAKSIRAIVLPKTAAHLVKKSETLRIFAPDKNLDADAYKFDYRLYYDVFVTKSNLETIHAIYA